jgi:hypothetical protein
MAGTKAQNCKLFYSADTGTTYDIVAGVTQVQKPEPSRGEIDMTDLQSTAKEYELDIPDYGSVSFPFNFDPLNTQHKALLVLESSSVAGQFKIEMVENGVSTVTSFVFTADVSSIAVTASVGGKQEGTLNLRVTGAVTIAHTATAES